MLLKKLLIFVLLVTSFLFCLCIYALDKDFEEQKSAHFIIYYKKGVDQHFIKDIIKSAEEYYNEIASNLGYYRYEFWTWDERAEIYIFSDQDSFQRETNQPSWAGGCASYQEKKLWTYPHASGFFDSVLPHELGHIIFREFVGFGDNIPLWFEEGVASYQERSKRYAAKNAVKELLSKNQLVSIEDLSAVRSPDDLIDSKKAEVFYYEAVSIIYFLINKYGDYKFAKLCKSLNEGANFDNALSNTFYNIKDTQDLQKEWIRYLNQ